MVPIHLIKNWAKICNSSWIRTMANEITPNLQSSSVALCHWDWLVKQFIDYVVHGSGLGTTISSDPKVLLWAIVLHFKVVKFQVHNKELRLGLWQTCLDDVLVRVHEDGNALIKTLGSEYKNLLNLIWLHEGLWKLSENMLFKRFLTDFEMSWMYLEEKGVGPDQIKLDAIKSDNCEKNLWS